MKSRLSPRATAAAILLASMGAAFVPLSASAHVTFQPHRHSAQELIQRFELIGVPSQGASLTFRVTGLPGSNARVQVATYPRELQMQEVQPGVYELLYVIAPRENPANVLAATAHVRAQDDLAFASLGRAAYLPGAVAVAPPTAVVPQGPRSLPPPPPPAPVREVRDSRGPEIAALFPANGERVSERGRTRISAQYRDDRAGVDPASVRLRVDGRDVTRDSRFDADSIEYRDDLQTGRHTAELTVRDRAGNLTRQTWTFDVVNSRPGNGWGDRNHEHDGRGEERRDDGRRW